MGNMEVLELLRKEVYRIIDQRWDFLRSEIKNVIDPKLDEIIVLLKEAKKRTEKDEKDIEELKKRIERLEDKVFRKKWVFRKKS